MNELVADQYLLLLQRLSATDPWPELAASGYLDLLRSESAGGAGLSLEDLFPLALATGRRLDAPPILETMAARLIDPHALNIDSTELVRIFGESPAARPLAAALAAAQMAGAMTQMQIMTLEYAMTRKQFGREIGTFQAVQHRLAVMAEQVLSAQIAAQAALIGPPLEICERRAAVAKCRAGEAAQQVSAIAHAVHGAIGISREHPLHHYVRRLREWRLACGGDSWWAAKLGAWVLAQPADVASLIQSL
jgi:acyl-CoA dehydrogenase